MRGAVVTWPGGVRIGYIRRALRGRSSTDSTPVTGSLVFSAPLDCFDVYCAAEFALCWLFCGMDCVWLARFGLFVRQQASVYWIMATEGAALVENRAGITFGVELYVSWDAPEAVVDIHSEGVVPLEYILDVVGLTGRRPDAAESRILKGRDVRSVRAMVSDSRGLDQNFFMMSRSSTWAMCLSRLFRYRSCRCAASSGHLRSFVTWCGYSRTWRGCMQKPSNGSGRLGRVVVFTAAH